MKLTVNENIKELEKNFKQACENETFVKLVKKLKLTKKDALKITSKLEDCVFELEHCQNCRGLANCQNAYNGHIKMPKNENNHVFFTYLPCKYLKEFNFKENHKGLYLYGNFGCGKTFLISALLNELKSQKQISCEIVYFPELLRTLKNDWDLYEEKINLYEQVDILCIDDIGAEKVTDWGRDEVLGTILQTRMNQNKTTFFTSNLSLEELESHFKASGSVDDMLKSRRIMERIKQLAIPMELISENKRK